MNASSTPILALMAEQAGDRTAWVHLIPAGTFTGIDGRGPYSMPDAAAVMNKTRAYHGKRKIVLDYEHQSINSQKNGHAAPAAGWIVGLEAREDGIWGLVEWTDKAAAHIASKEYRYISPVFLHTKSGEVLFLRNATLTNTPNLDQLVALNRAETSMDNETVNAKLAAAAKLLGLPETAGQAEILAKFQELSTLASDLASLTGDPAFAVNSANPDPTRFVPIGDFERVVAEGNKLRQGITKDAAETHVAAHIRSGSLAPFLKDWAISLCTVNKPQFDAFMSRVGPHLANITVASHARATPPGDGKAEHQLGEDELAICRNMGLTPEQYINAKA
ncbi:phage protease [Rhizobium sp. YS-1r]|uniref:phage protease n=1 Tax=Rhizobium sp. YS-1r TaxID=1532558 RepID=UPI00050DD81F|nr:phage protease [Rhizobium sp. YS-1r]KGD95686.1 hypothetical protein JL39_19695 [Rhizobium sp. YS-1r]